MKFFSKIAFIIPIILMLNAKTAYSQEIDSSLLDFFQHVPENSKDSFSFLLPDHILDFLQKGDDRTLEKIAGNSKFTLSRDLAYAAKTRVVGDIAESNRYLESIIYDKYKNKKITLEILLCQAMLAGNYMQQNKIKMWSNMLQKIYEETTVINRINGGKPINFSQILPVRFIYPYKNLYDTYLDSKKENVLKLKDVKNDDHLFFDIYVNKVKETSILDTGIFISVFPERFINRSDIHVIGKTKISDIFGNTKESYLAQVDSITIGNVHVKNLLVQISKGANNVIIGENLLRLFKNIKVDSKNIYLNENNVSCQYNLLEGSILNGVYSSPRISAYIDQVFYSSIIFDLGMAFDKHTSSLDNNVIPIIFLFNGKKLGEHGKYVEYSTFVDKHVDVQQYYIKHDITLQENIFRNSGSIYVEKDGVNNLIIINRDILKLVDVNINYINKKLCFINKK